MGRSDMMVLTLDGSTDVCSAALLEPREYPGGTGAPRPREGAESVAGVVNVFKVVARRNEGDGRAQARILLRLVDEMLEEAGRRLEDLATVVVGRGPGTFTGVRVTVATARALSLALTIPVLGVSTLGALAAGAAECTRERKLRGQEADEAAVDLQGVEIIVPIVDARRGQLFYSLYRARWSTGMGGLRYWAREEDFGVCNRDALGELVGPGMAVIVGDEGLVPADLPPTASFMRRTAVAEYLLIGQGYLEEPGPLPEGRRLEPWLREVMVGAGAAGAQRIHETPPGLPGTPESVKPIYVRPPDADVHITRMKDPWADGSSGR